MRQPSQPTAPRTVSVYSEPTYPPQYYYSKAYKYAYWTPRSRSGRKVALLGLLSFLPSFMGFMRHKSARRGVTPQDLSLFRTLTNRAKKLSADVSIPGIDMGRLREILGRLEEKISGANIDRLQKILGEALEEVGKIIIDIGQKSSEWFKNQHAKTHR